jgi:hypothetical protein
MMYLVVPCTVIPTWVANERYVLCLRMAAARLGSRFRPCIDLHRGQVKQIVGGTLSEDDPERLKTNYVARFVAIRPRLDNSRLSSGSPVNPLHTLRTCIRNTDL